MEKVLLIILEKIKCNYCKKLFDDELKGVVDLIFLEKMKLGIWKCIVKVI